MPLLCVTANPITLHTFITVDLFEHQNGMYNAIIAITHYTAIEYVYTIPNVSIQPPVVKLLMAVMRHWKYIPKS